MFIQNEILNNLFLIQVLKVAILAEKYAVDYSWYVDTILNLIRIAGDYVSEEVWYRVIQIVINRDDVQGYAAKTVFEVTVHYILYFYTLWPSSTFQTNFLISLKLFLFLFKLNGELCLFWSHFLIIENNSLNKYLYIRFKKNSCVLFQIWNGQHKNCDRADRSLEFNQLKCYLFIHLFIF